VVANHLENTFSNPFRDNRLQRYGFVFEPAKYFLFFFFQFFKKSSLFCSEEGVEGGSREGERSGDSLIAAPKGRQDIGQGPLRCDTTSINPVGATDNQAL